MLFTEWPTAGSRRNRRRRLAARALIAAVCLFSLAGCSLLPQEEELENLPEIRTPKISQKPEYPVKRGTLEVKVTGSGKLMSEREENLFFTEDNRRIVAVYVKAGDEVKKGQVLAELDNGDTERQIRRKEIELEKAGLDLKESMRNSAEADSVTLRKLQLDYALLEEELADLRERLRRSKLTAPYDGTIVSFSAEKGDVAKAYEKVGRIADMNDLVAAVKFNAGDLADIAPGMAATVSINTAGDGSGTVRRLPVSDSASGGEDDSLDSYLLIDVPLPEGVSHGTPLSASVIVESRENVLSIPVSALRTQNSRSYVLVSHPDGTKGEMDVEIGVQTATDVEIIKGLEEGQKVVGK
ncbi:efflux RND transporter periplasmic adaptor subunit [Paenibacillus alkalitolerans]|uniref:efflux RND transporter periplasmic adaptor subunit n=1 Tax=Paenibacillus alkalitolerans TaxID=2799335 RepID=UPI0018F43583|nr:efflux RND transporter periplasmic adaptor subunit [Paenibacillus alkalitolerans]